MKVAYFTPNDREPPEDRHERLGRVLKHVQEYYRKQMESHGYGPLTFALEWSEPGKLKIYDVKGEGNRYDYPEGAAWKVHQEVREALRKQHGMDADNEYLLILGNFVEWKEDLWTEYGPRGAGGGSVAAGYAWASDDLHVDPDLLTSKEAGGHSARLGNYSLGKYNAYHFGVIAHELGHCFGYPHDSERDSQKKTLGVSLMGTGNYNYAEEIRGEGAGAFLTDAAALFLSTTRAFNPAFNRVLEGYFRFDRLEADYMGDKLVLSGRLDTRLPVAGIIAFNDNLNIPDDYDATSWVAKPDEKGDFKIEIGELEKVPYQLRLKFLFHGGFLDLSMNYSNLSGEPDLEPINTFLNVGAINRFLDEKRYDEVEKILNILCEKYPQNPKWARKLKHLATVQSPPERFKPGKVDESQAHVDLTYAATLEESVGWYEPSRGILRDLGFMEVCGAFFESGIFAHANSRYVFSLDQKWKEFEFAYGIQDRHPGSVVFVIRGDGKELFRSQIVKSGELHMGQVNISGVDKLELITEESENLNHNDWGLWLRPTLIR